MHSHKTEKKLANEEKIKFPDLNETISYHFCYPKNTVFTFLQTVNKYKIILNSFEKICLAQTDTFDFTCALFAIVSLGKKAILLPNYEKETIKKYSKEYDLLITNNFAEKVILKNIEIQNYINLNLNTKIHLFTSGSNGEPKKIIKFFENLWAECRTLETIFGNIIKDSIIIGTVSHFHIYGLIFRILWPIYSSRKTIENLIFFQEDLEKINNFNLPITLISSPAFLNRMINEIENISDNIFIFSSGGALNVKIAKKLSEKIKKYPIEIYGSTETGGIGHRVQENENTSWSYFPLVKGVKDDRGCLRVSSPFIHENSFQTNDIIIQEKNNRFKLLGRIDRTYKIEEKRICLVQMENLIKKIDFVEDAYCIVLNLPNRDIIGVVIAESQDWRKKPKIEKVKFIKSYLSGHYEKVLIPKDFRFLQKIPYNKQSKIIKKEIIGIFNEQ